MSKIENEQPLKVFQCSEVRVAAGRVWRGRRGRTSKIKTATATSQQLAQQSLSIMDRFVVTAATATSLVWISIRSKARAPL